MTDSSTPQVELWTEMEAVIAEQRGAHNSKLQQELTADWELKVPK